MAVQTAYWSQVSVLKKWQSAKGTLCVMVGWMNAGGAGEHVFYGEDVANAVAVGDTVDIQAQPNGDFFRDIQVTGGSLQAQGSKRKAA